MKRARSTQRQEYPHSLSYHAMTFTSRSSITNTLRLLGLPPTIQHLLADGRLSAGHARALLATPDRALQEELAQLAVEEGWTVRTIELAVKQGGAPVAPAAPAEPPPAPSEPTHDGAGVAPTTRLRPPGLLELEELLAAHLDTRVSVQMGAKKGRIGIEFADLEDLERIYRRMTESSGPPSCRINDSTIVL